MLFNLTNFHLLLLNIRDQFLRNYFIASLNNMESAGVGYVIGHIVYLSSAVI